MSPCCQPPFHIADAIWTQPSPCWYNLPNFAKNQSHLTETIINLESVNPLEFFGVNNGKLDLLKKKFPLLKILSRGTQIKLSGAPEQIEAAKEKIETLIQYLERNGHMSQHYFEQIPRGRRCRSGRSFCGAEPE